MRTFSKNKSNPNASIMKSILFPTIGLCIALLPSLTSETNAQSIPRRGSDVIPQEVDSAYKKGLAYLSKIQAADGSYGDRYGKQPGIVGVCTLAFLAHGEDSENGPYAKNIKNGIDFIIKSQNDKNGYLGNSMYNHGFATLALAEAYGMVNDPRIEKALEKAVKLITSSQNANPKGAWRYSPESKSSDSTVAGCQLVALLAARNAGIPVPNENIDKALKYMASCRASNGGYGYTSKTGARTTLTAIGSLCMSLAKKKDDKSFPTVTKYLVKRIDSTAHHHAFYHEYYMAQALFHADEESWMLWNEKNSKLMSASQMPDGSWSDRSMGQAGSTGFALLSMALNYRLLPIYEK